MSVQLLKTHKTFEGLTQFWEHDSASTLTKMKFSTYIPQGTVKGCLIWLSGLTCTDENFITKAGAQKYLAENNLMVICPDTSPRGLNLPQEHDSYDFGSGASFYLDATTEGYKDHYRMSQYISKELIEILASNFKIPVNKISIFGHSMGGHGALTLGLKNPNTFQSISAFSPITNPIQCAWGKKAFAGYLGQSENTWKDHDATELILSGKTHKNTILVHQGAADDFLKQGQLLPENFKNACEAKNQNLTLKMCEDYDHSYYFIATFIEEHIKFHAAHLG